MSDELQSLSHCDEHLRRGQGMVLGDHRQFISFEVADGRLTDLDVKIPDQDVAKCLASDLHRWHLPTNMHGTVELIVFY